MKEFLDEQVEDEFRPAKIFFKPKEFDSKFVPTSEFPENEDNDTEEDEQRDERKFTSL